MPNKKKGTKTSRFGSKGRENHDSSIFYDSKLYDTFRELEDSAPYIENPIDDKFLDEIIHDSSESMQQLPDSSIHLMITSPPYNVVKEYDNDLSFDDYLNLLKNVFLETYRVLVPGGRACINIANIGRKPYIPLNAYITRMMIEINFLMRAEIIWDKGSSSGTSTAWGSWKSASNPTLRDVHEYILVFSKGRYKRESNGRKPTVTKDEFLENTKSVWKFPTESAKRVGHPAPFPVGLPYRLIQFYTFKGDTVLDPFIGSGTTAIAALKTGRHYIGFEIDDKYVETSRKRISDFSNQLPLFD